MLAGFIPILGDIADFFVSPIKLVEQMIGEKAGAPQAEIKAAAEAKAKGHRFFPRFTTVVIILLLFGAAVLILPQTYIGSLMISGISGQVGPLKGVIATAKAAPNVFMEMLQPGYWETQWTSQQVDSEYQQSAKDVGVRVKNLIPLRPSFYPRQAIEIKGILDLGAMTGVPLTAGISASAPDIQGFCFGKYLLDTCQAGLTCSIEGERGALITLNGGERVRDKRFNCTGDVVKSGEIEPGFVKTVPITFNTGVGGATTVTGRQIFIVDPAEVDKVYAKLENPTVDDLAQPILGLNPSEDVLKTSWQNGDPTINFAMGIYGLDLGIVEASTPSYNNTWTLGVRVENPAFAGENKITNISKIFIELPYDKNIHVIEKTPFTCTVADSTYEPHILVYHCEAKPGTLKKPLEAAQDALFFLDFYVDKDYLAGGPYSSFLVFSQVSYSYLTTEYVNVDILGEAPV